MEHWSKTTPPPRGRVRIITDAEQDVVMEARDNGWSLRAIARELSKPGRSVSVAAVYTAIKHGTARRQQKSEAS